MRRRRPIGKKIYTIEYLLNKQPKSLAKDELYSVMLSYLNYSPNLKQVKFNKRCYSLLNNAVIKPEHLVNFYKTYKLPKHPFFPLFFIIKRNYLVNKDNRKKNKSIYINQKMKDLAPGVSKFLKIVLAMEKNMNRAGLNPLYSNLITPGTKKQADIFTDYSHSDWLLFFRNYLGLLLSHYGKSSSWRIDYLLACFILNCLPVNPSVSPSESMIKNQYRKLSKKYHPDAGGDSELFLEIKWARDVLLKA